MTLPVRKKISVEITSRLSDDEIVSNWEENRDYLVAGNLLQTGKLISRAVEDSLSAQTIVKLVNLPVSLSEAHFEPNFKEGILEAKNGKAALAFPSSETIEIYLTISADKILEIQLRFRTASDFNSVDLENKITAILFLEDEKYELTTKLFLNSLTLKIPKIKAKLGGRQVKLKLTNASNLELFFDELIVGDGQKSELAIRIIPEETYNLSGGPLVRKVKKAFRLIKNGEIESLIRIVKFIANAKLGSIKKRLRLSTFSIFFLSIFSALIVQSCVLPPEGNNPRVFTKQELAYVSSIQTGMSFSLAGRFDEAENELRIALNQVVKNKEEPTASLLSDLGFVLRAQGKLDDAKIMLEKALAQEPYSLLTRINLGRTYFELGDTPGALKEFKRVEQDYLDYWNSKPDRRLSKNFETADILSVYENLSIIYAEQGLAADAVCYSQKALEIGDASYTAQAHARFLMTLEQFSVSSDILKFQISNADVEDPSMLVDLGVSLLLQNNINLARESFDRVLTLTVVTPDLRLLAQLLRFNVANRDTDTETIGLLEKSLSNQTEDLCDSEGFSTPPFWPLRLKELIEQDRTKLCKAYA